MFRLPKRMWHISPTQSAAPTAETTPSHSDRTYLLLVVTIATIGGFLFGYDTMIFSGAQIFLMSYFRLTAMQLGFAGASVIIGSIAGTLLASAISDAIGCKRTMILAGVLFALSAIDTALPKTLAVL